MDRLEVAKLLNAASSRFVAKQTVLGTLTAQEIEARAGILQGSLGSGNSVAQAEREAEIGTYNITMEKAKVRHEIIALEEQINSYRFLIKYDLVSTL